MSNEKKHRLDQTEAVVATRSPRVFANNCPRNPEHENTRVYKTKDRTRYCICDDCGELWKQIGPAAGGAA